MNIMIVNKLLKMHPLLQNVRRFHCSTIKKVYEGSGKSTMNVINVTGPKLFITSCTPIGFKLSDNSVLLGPLAIFPRTILCWNVAGGKDINDASLSLFTTLEPKLDVLILGLETKYDYNKITELRKLIIEKNISAEILPVEKACGIYNFLCEEGRHVAAGLIPPLPEETYFHKKITAAMKSVRKDLAIESK